MRPQTVAVIKEYAYSIAVALVLALLVRAFIVQAFKIPTGSMRPTLIEGDRIFVNKFIYRFRAPKTGEVIVFKAPEEPGKDFIKRLIARGDQTVEIKEGKIFVDGVALDSSAIFKKNYYYNRGDFAKMGLLVRVPKDYYFVLGDNSASSRDSRYWGFLPKKNLIGKALVIYWPLYRIRIVR